MGCSTDKYESKGIIVNECSTEEDESEFIHKIINIQKYTKNEAEYKGSSVTDEALIYFNIFKCGKNILNRLDVKYDERAWSPQKINTLRRCCKLLLTTMIATMHHFPMRSFNKKSVKS